MFPARNSFEQRSSPPGGLATTSVHGTRPSSSHARNPQYLLVVITLTFKHYREVVFRKALEAISTSSGRERVFRRADTSSTATWSTQREIGTSCGSHRERFGRAVASVHAHEHFDTFRAGVSPHHRHFKEGHHGEHIVKEYWRAVRASARSVRRLFRLLSLVPMSAAATLVGVPVSLVYALVLNVCGG